MESIVRTLSFTFISFNIKGIAIISLDIQPPIKKYRLAYPNPYTLSHISLFIRKTRIQRNIHTSDVMLLESTVKFGTITLISFLFLVYLILSLYIVIQNSFKQIII